MSHFGEGGEGNGVTREPTLRIRLQAAHRAALGAESIHPSTPMKNKSATSRPGTKPGRLDSTSPSSAAVSVRPSQDRGHSRIPTQEEITARARQIWQERGCPVDRDLEMWVEAERQLSQPGRPSSGLPVSGDTEQDAEDAEKVQDRIATTAAPAAERSPTSL